MKIREDIVLYGKLATAELGYSTCRVEVTSDCFQKCRGCVSWRDHEKKKMNASFKLSQITQLVLDLFEFPMFEHLTFTGGDPQTWPVIDEFLKWWNLLDHNAVRFQISTALARPIAKPALWNEVDRYLISMDAATPEMYFSMRGDRDNDMMTILEHASVLTKPALGFMITVRKENQKEVVPIVQYLNEMYCTTMPNIRKIQILASIGSLKGDLDKEFWDRWRVDKEFIASSTEIPVSFCDEDIVETREICASREVRHIRCWTSRMSLHVKPNGDVYPCCLIGGEAIDIHTNFKLGNVFENRVQDIYQSYFAQHFYQSQFCQEVCQWKQLQMNIAGERGSKTILSMP